jgi:NAD(P)-dependent dehydrogenase (short-subunit alcohol dehydrogenase family)
VADEVAVRAAMADGCRQLGVVEILVNNAGFARDGNLVDMSVDDWDAVIATHRCGGSGAGAGSLNGRWRRRAAARRIRWLTRLGGGGRAFVTGHTPPAHDLLRLCGCERVLPHRGRQCRHLDDTRCAGVVRTAGS